MAASRRFIALFGFVLAAAACTGGPSGRTLSFSDVQSLNAGVSGEWVLEEYPFARGVDRWPDGTIRSLNYPVTDPMGKSQSVSLSFDQRGVLTSKQYSGPILRPPLETSK